MIAGLSPSKARNGRTCDWIRATHSATVSLELRERSAVGFGSPINPVDPPTRHRTR